MPIPALANVDLSLNPALFGNSADCGALLLSVKLVDWPGNLNESALAAVQNNGPRIVLRRAIIYVPSSCFPPRGA
jgi:hypothetical protein